MTHLLAPTVGAFTKPYEDAASLRGGAVLRAISALAAAALLAAAGFIVAHSLGPTAIPPVGICSETCAPPSTRQPPSTSRFGAAPPARTKSERNPR